MAVTNVGDIIIPEVFLPYAIQRTMELNAFVQSGVVTQDARFTALANDGGVTAHMPYFEDLQGDEEIIGRTGDVSVDAIGTDQDICVKMLRQKAYGARDIAALLAGADPMMAIGDLFAGWWVRQDQKRLLYSLKGVFASSSMSDLVKDISLQTGSVSEANYFTGRSFIDAKQLLGDAKEKLSAIAIHSEVEAWLSKLDLIDIIPDSEGKGQIKTFQGLRVVVDDGMPYETVAGQRAYTSYMFAQGAVAMADGNVDKRPLGAMGTWRLEYDRQARAGESSMIMRRTIIQHVRGVKWNGASMAADTPTNTEIQNGANWTRVYEKKAMRVVKFVHNIGA